MFTCRTCHVAEPATSYCVYQNKLNSQVGATAGVTQDVSSDPTVCDPDFLDELGFIPGFCLCCGQEIACWVCAVRPFTRSQASNVAHPEDDNTPKTAPSSSSDSFIV